MIREIYLAAGCFWGAQHYLQLLRGVTFTEVGFANGHSPHPTYKEVYTDTTGYAETVHVKYDSSIISLKELIYLYFQSINPTALNRQGEDEGTRYRTGIYYTCPSDKDTILQVYNHIASQYTEPLQVEVLPLTNFYRAEEYHQQYLDKNPTGYCHLPRALFEMAKNYRPGQ